MLANSKSSIVVIGLAIFLTWAIPAVGSSIDQLEKLAGSDFIPEIREAASKVLAKKYLDQKTSAAELIGIAETAGTDQLRQAATRALSRRYEDAKEINSLEDALEKAKQLEEKVKSGEVPAVKQAASLALGFYYLAFNVNDMPSYSMSKIESIAIGAREAGLRRAAASTLVSIYPNHYSADELRDILSSSSDKAIKRGATGGLALRYWSTMPPNPEIGELKQIASDETENRWIREAAGQGFGELAADEFDASDLEELALSGNTAEIRAGAARAWSIKLIRSEKTKEDLLRMACAATGFAPTSYRSAITAALADRMLKTGETIRGG